MFTGTSWTNYQQQQGPSPKITRIESRVLANKYSSLSTPRKKNQSGPGDYCYQHFVKVDQESTPKESKKCGQQSRWSSALVVLVEASKISESPSWFRQFQSSYKKGKLQKSRLRSAHYYGRVRQLKYDIGRRNGKKCWSNFKKRSNIQSGEGELMPQKDNTFR